MQTCSEALDEQMVNSNGSLSEKDRRRYAAVEAAKLGHGGITSVAQRFGCDPSSLVICEPSSLRGNLLWDTTGTTSPIRRELWLP